jgi:hypothetical protein
MMKTLALLMTAVVIAMATFVFGLTEQAAARGSRGPFASVSTRARALALEEEGEVEEGETEETEEDEEESEEGGSEPGLPQGVPNECLEYTAAARVLSSLSRQTVRLELRYDSSESGEASLSYTLKGSKGSLKLGTAKWHLSPWGHLERTAHLSDPELVKLQAARSFTVQVDLPGTPSFCEIYGTRHLTSQHRTGEQTIWSERPSGTQPQRRSSLQR